MIGRASARVAGFTLLEIVVALTIFGITLAALFTSFRTGLKAYEMGVTHAEAQQTGRYAVNQFSQDLRSIFYKSANEYNVTRRQREALLEQREQQQLQGRGNNEMEDETLPELGPAIDLSFLGEDGGEEDQVSFVHMQGTKKSEERALWGLERVRYFISNGALYRSTEDITAPEVDENGYEIPKATPPRVDKIANNAVGLDIKYGYYYDGQYLMADDWDSNASQYRNPESEEDEDITTPAGDQGGMAVSQQNQQGQQQQQQQKSDELPGWVEVTFKFSDPRNENRIRTYRQTVLLYNVASQETYVPEEEQEIRGSGGRSSREQASKGRSSGRSRSGSREGRR